MNLEPKLDLNDSSRNDDSIKQEHVTINASNGATINSNSGNGQRGEITRMFAMITTILFSIICDIGLGWMLYAGHAKMSRNLDSVIATMSQKIEKQSKEGSIWLLRHDILRSIDVCEARDSITPQEWKRLVEEYRYYLSIGGNYDVEDRFESFRTKVMGTREITMK